MGGWPFQDVDETLPVFHPAGATKDGVPICSMQIGLRQDAEESGMDAELRA
ncbi:hypothetical protein [Aurantivibrio plasticivorans]